MVSNNFIFEDEATKKRTQDLCSRMKLKLKALKQIENQPDLAAKSPLRLFRIKTLVELLLNQHYKWQRIHNQYQKLVEWLPGREMISPQGSSI